MAEAAQSIRAAVQEVEALRAGQAQSPQRLESVRAVKRLQSRRFAGTYADLLLPGPHRLAAQFFLEELYGARDFSARDQQFGRIAGALERLFPAQVVQTAVNLAALHALSERLDDHMASIWLETSDGTLSARYLHCWRRVGQRAERERQVRDVLTLGRELARLTRVRGLRTMLRMMRGAAQAAGLGALQAFLETGFDRFAEMSATPGCAERFLETVETRESALMTLLFEGSFVACETELSHLLGEVP